MMILTILSLVLVVLFVSTTIHHTKSIPDSVSAMVYALHPTWRYLWTAWLWAISMLLLPPLMEKLGSYWQFLGFLWCASMAFCGAMPLIKGGDNKIHNALGVIAGVFSQACIFVLCPWWFVTWTVFLVFVLSDKFRDTAGIWHGKSCFVAEVICYVTIVGALLTM